MDISEAVTPYIALKTPTFIIEEHMAGLTRLFELYPKDKGDIYNYCITSLQEFYVQPKIDPPRISTTFSLHNTVHQTKSPSSGPHKEITTPF